MPTIDNPEMAPKTRITFCGTTYWKRNMVASPSTNTLTV